MLDLKASDFKALEQFQPKCLRQIQSLPDKTQNSAVLALLRVLPDEAVVHKNMLNLFGHWIMSDGIEKEIALRQLAVKLSCEMSWFNRIKELLLKFNLPTPSELIENTPSKDR